MGYGGVKVANIFALRSTDPKALYQHADPIGKDNDTAILELVAGAGIVICAWGGHSNLNNRGTKVLELLKSADITPYYLALNKDGTPKHPLYIGYELLPSKWKSNSRNTC